MSAMTPAASSVKVLPVVSSKGRIVLPAGLRQRDRILTGQRFEIERLEAGQYLLKKQPSADNEGVVEWLLACPEKNWFEPIRSESTDLTEAK
jgi:AbrB family looped-hinge helix DNA binding protein